jgi:hypothetical protein
MGQKWDNKNGESRDQVEHLRRLEVLRYAKFDGTQMGPQMGRRA